MHREEKGARKIKRAHSRSRGEDAKVWFAAAAAEEEGVVGSCTAKRTNPMALSLPVGVESASGCRLITSNCSVSSSIALESALCSGERGCSVLSANAAMELLAQRDTSA